MSFATTAALALALISVGVLVVRFTLILLRNHWEQIIRVLVEWRGRLRSWVTLRRRSAQQVQPSGPYGSRAASEAILPYRLFASPLVRRENMSVYQRRGASTLLVRADGSRSFRHRPASTVPSRRRPLTPITRVRTFILAALTGVWLTSVAASGPPVAHLQMIVVVDPACPHALAILERVAEFRRLRPEVPLRLLVPDPSAFARAGESVMAAIQRADLTLDWNPGQLRALGVTVTPTVIALDAAGRGVRATGAPDLVAVERAMGGRP